MEARGQREIRKEIPHSGRAETWHEGMKPATSNVLGFLTGISTSMGFSTTLPNDQL
jgi:hypothetical protein